jgi:hypothetical protein
MDHSKEFERMEHRIETAESFGKMKNTPYNRSKIHGVYHACGVSVRLMNEADEIGLADLWREVADIIEMTGIRLNPNFQIKKKKKLDKQQHL